MRRAARVAPDALVSWSRASGRNVFARPQFVEKTKSEPGCVFYEWTLNGDVVFCREAYADAEGALAHLENVGALLGEMLKISDVERLEIHGPAAELEKLKVPLAGYQPTWFVYECGVER